MQSNQKYVQSISNIVKCKCTNFFLYNKTRKIPIGDCKGNAFMSTTIARGRAKGIVVRTGIQTEVSKT